jgi:hypothetical protein
MAAVSRSAKTFTPKTGESTSGQKRQIINVGPPWIAADLLRCGERW